MKKQLLIWGLLWASLLLCLAIAIPGLMVKKTQRVTGPLDGGVTNLATAALPSRTVPVYMNKTQTVQNIPLEEYVRGVVAAEMPIEFEEEALKAQALAARTYIMRRYIEKDTSSVPVSDALVTDTVSHQAFISVAELKDKWGSEYESKLRKLDEAIKATQGLILTYDGKPINAVFFSTSNGYTENAEDYWKDPIPYLKSVPSPWDRQISPKYKASVTLDYQDALAKLGLKGITPVSSSSSALRVLEYSEGHRIKRVQIAGKLFTGREVREKLGLASSQFDWKLSGGRITFTTYGYGHGVGMSQWGANGMAMEGKTAEQIVKHYYTGISITPIENILK